MDKVYKRKSLELAWQRVKRNRGVAGIDGQTLEEFESQLDEQLDRLHDELKSDTYLPQAVRQKLIPKPGQPDRVRPLGIPNVYDRVCQQALLNGLEPIFEPVFDDASLGYRRGRSAKDALRKIWKELNEGYEWIVDADLKDFFGSVDHEKLLTLVNDGAGCVTKSGMAEFVMDIHAATDYTAMYVLHGYLLSCPQSYQSTRLETAFHEIRPLA